MQSIYAREFKHSMGILKGQVKTQNSNDSELMSTCCCGFHYTKGRGTLLLCSFCFLKVKWGTLMSIWVVWWQNVLFMIKMDDYVIVLNG